MCAHEVHTSVRRQRRRRWGSVMWRGRGRVTSVIRGRLPAIGRQDGASSAMARRPRTRAAEGLLPRGGAVAGGRRCTRHGAAPPGFVRS